MLCGDGGGAGPVTHDREREEDEGSTRTANGERRHGNVSDLLRVATPLRARSSIVLLGHAFGASELACLTYSGGATG